MKAVFDSRLWMSLQCDLPFGFSGPADSFPLGVCVKARMRVTPDCMVKIGCDKNGAHGRVSKNTPEECVIIGHGYAGNVNERFVWSGTHEEMLSVWVID